MIIVFAGILSGLACKLMAVIWRPLMSFPVEKSLNKAKKHFKNGEKMAAAQLYQAVLSKFPKNQRAI